MITFLIRQEIKYIMEDYLNRVVDYIEKKLKKEVQIIPYETLKDIPDEWGTIIFVQEINIQQKKQVQKPQPMCRTRQRKGLPYIPYKPIVNKHLLDGKTVYLLNTEQMSRITLKNQVVAQIKGYNVKVLDYSLENIAILKQSISEVYHIPFPLTIRDRPEKDIDIVSLKTSKWRNQVCSSIKLPITDFAGKWGAERDSFIDRSKILLNIHYTPREYRIFESIRCYGALEGRTIVISERGSRDDEVLLKDYIIFTDINNMENVIKDVLENYEEYYNKFFNDESIARMYNLIDEAMKNGPFADSPPDE